MDERIKAQVIDMKRKCIAKVKSIQAECDAKLSESATVLSATKSAADARVNELENVVHERESEIAVLQSRLHSLESDLEKQTRVSELANVVRERESEITVLQSRLHTLSATKSATDARVNELESVVRERESEIAVLQSRLHALESDIEKQTSEIQLKLDRSREQLAELESTLADTDRRQKEALDAQADKLNRENGEQYASLKQRAATRIGQIKKLLADKESSVSEVNRVADELRARLAACEDELHDAQEMGKDAENKNSKIAELSDNLADVRRLLQQRDNEMTEKEWVMDDFRSQLENLEKKLQSSVSEIDVLTGSLSAAEQERQRLAERCEVEMRTAALNSDQELERLRSEYEEKKRGSDEEQNARIKQLVKEFQLQMAKKEKEFQSNYNEVLGTFFSLSVISVHVLTPYLV